MATLIANRFTSWELTPEEVQQGYIQTDPQTKVLQNLLSDYATEKVSLKYDPSNPLGFVQAEAELQGKITLLEYLLDQNIYYQTEAYNKASQQSKE